MAVADVLRKITEDYVRARQTEPFPGQFRDVFHRLARAVGDLPSVRERDELEVRAGFGIGSWSRAPGLTILARRATATPQQGVFVSFKFPQDMRGVYVTLNQGHRHDIARLGRKKARERWAVRARELRAQAGVLEGVGFRLDGDIELGLDDANTTADFAASTIAWRFHAADRLPDDAELDRELAALLEVYLQWVESSGEEALELEHGALDEMRTLFLERMPGFVSFEEPGPDYQALERGFKDELAGIFRAEVLPLLTALHEDADSAERAIGTLHELLTKRKLQGGGPQILVNWRATEHLGRLRGEEALRAASLYRELLAGSGDGPERVEAFNTGYVPILGRYMRSGVQGVSRILPTLLLMLAEPERNIAVRTTLFDDSAKRLLGHRLLSGEPMSAEDYAGCLAFAWAIRRALEGFGWRPKDMIDVQGFLWSADLRSKERAEGTAGEAPFRDALDPESGRRIWKIAPGEGARFWPECLQNGYICVGWDDIGDLRQYPDESADAFREAFRDSFAEIYTGSAGKLAVGTRKAKELWSLRSIEPGDIVLANRGAQEILAMGEVVEPGYVYDESRAEYRHTVLVRWHTDLRRELADRLTPGLRAMFMNSTVLELTREAFAAILDGRIEDVAPPAGDSTSEAYAEPPFPEIVTLLHKTGLRLTERMIRRYHVAVKARGFVILAGVSGTGKTWLAEAYADAVGAHRLIVPVAPSWNSNEDLLGFTSPLDGAYRHTDFSRFLLEAAHAFESAPTDGGRPFHVVLDEMNLARVEHYFSAFLSALEQRHRYRRASLTLVPRRSASTRISSSSAP